MILMDVNILVYADREDTARHPAYRDWVEEAINGGGAYGVCELVLSVFTFQLHKFLRLAAKNGLKTGGSSSFALSSGFHHE